MGRDKALLVGRDGRTLAERALSALRLRFERVFVLGGSAARFGVSGVGVIDDAPGVRGPMAGVIAALRSDSEADWLIAACDMPAFDERGIEWLMDRYDGESGGTFGRIAGRASAEPLPAIYARRSVERLEEAARRGEFSLSAVLPKLGARVFEIPAEIEAQWCNVNTPEEWEKHVGERDKSG